MANLSEKQTKLVVNNVHLLLGLHALLTLFHMEDMGGDLLQRLHFLFPSKEFTLYCLDTHTHLITTHYSSGPV